MAAARLSVSPKSEMRSSARTLAGPDRHLSIILPSAASTVLGDKRTRVGGCRGI